MNCFSNLRAFHSDTDLRRIANTRYSLSDRRPPSHAELLQENLDRRRQRELLSVSEERTFTPRALLRRQEETFRRRVLQHYHLRRERRARELIRQFCCEYL